MEKLIIQLHANGVENTDLIMEYELLNISNQDEIEELQKVSKTLILMHGETLVTASVISYEQNIGIGIVDDIIINNKYRRNVVISKLVEFYKYYFYKKNCYKIEINCNESDLLNFKNNGFACVKNNVKMNMYIFP